MEVLLAGNTGYVTEQFIESAFPNSHVVVTGFSSIQKEQKNIRLVRPTDLVHGKDILEVYDFDQIVFFSHYLTCHGKMEGEMERLRIVLQYCRGRNTKLIYLAGPAVRYAEKTGKTVLASSAESLCLHYMNVGGVQLKIVHLPFLYTATCQDDFIYRIFELADEKRQVVFQEESAQPASFLSTADLSELLFRIFDSWDIGHEIISVPDVFSITFNDLGTALEQYFPGTKVQYTGELEIEALPPDDKVTRYLYGWFPKISILSDMPQLYENYLAHRKPKACMADKVNFWIKKHGKLWTLGEVILLFLLSEILNAFTGAITQFRYIDLRLLYVVITSTIYGINMGMVGAALASLSLLTGFLSEGAQGITLFYEPANWIPFAMYFLIAAVCGYTQMKNQDSLFCLKKDNALLREKLAVVQNLYHDSVQEMQALKRQILGQKDSFGKIFDITRKLDSTHPQELFIKTLQVMENVLENHSIKIYSLGKNQTFARLEAASREITEQSPRSLKIQDYTLALEAINKGSVWVNQSLLPDYPMYMVGIRRNDRLALLLMIQSADYSQMNLHYQNLFKILCGLVEAALLRAIKYQEALYDAQHLKHTIFMKESYFRKKLSLYRSMQEEKIADYTLIKLDYCNLSLDEAEEILKTNVRENDTVGIFENQELYLILHQTTPVQAQIVIHRLQASGLGCQIIPHNTEDTI